MTSKKLFTVLTIIALVGISTALSLSHVFDANRGTSNLHVSDGMMSSNSLETTSNGNSQEQRSLSLPVPAGWTRYSDTHHNFKIDYPANLPFSRQFRAEYLLSSNTWRQNSYREHTAGYTGDDGGSGEQVAEIVVDRHDLGHDYIHAYVNIGVSSESDEVSHCLDDEAAYDLEVASSSITLNGSVFRKFVISRGAMSQSAAISSYRTVRWGKCFALEGIVTASHTEAPTVELRQRQNRDEQLIVDILNTFAFE